MDIVYQYPPELSNLLIDTIPLLCRSKSDTILFFRGAGVGDRDLADLEERVTIDRSSINKYEICRTLIARINERGEAGLRVRREVLKRVADFEDFSTCWENDRLKAKGLVSEVRRVINVKDSFTRMQQERNQEAEQRRRAVAQERDEKLRRQQQIAKLKEELFSLFGGTNPQRRGKAVEGILNRLFKEYGILVSEAFEVRSPDGAVLEQIDGVIEFSGHHYLVEMKWWNEPIGKPQIAESLVNVYHRGQTRGIFISASGFTGPAVELAKESLQKTVTILVGFNELVMMLERQEDLRALLQVKVDQAITRKNPLFSVVNA